jgi:hypothetical protein
MMILHAFLFNFLFIISDLNFTIVANDKRKHLREKEDETLSSFLKTIIGMSHTVVGWPHNLMRILSHRKKYHMHNRSISDKTMVET